MKLIFAIVNKDDSNVVSSALTRGGFSVTKLATTGGFLQAGNTTFLVGTDDTRVDEVLSIIEKHSKKRTQMVPHHQLWYGELRLLSGGGDGGRRHGFRDERGPLRENLRSLHAI